MLQPDIARIMAAVYATMQPQEELVALFNRNFTLDPVSQPAPAPAPAPAPVPAAQEPQEERKIVYISQHYNHSAHIAKQNAQPPRLASEPPQSEHEVVERVLREHGVDPSCLSPAQLHLFKTVDNPEKLRLLELWRVCPPADSNNNNWSITTVDQEEALARLRFEQQQQQLIDQQLQHELNNNNSMMQNDSPPSPEPEPEAESVMSLDGTPLTPIQAGDGRWMVMDSAAASYHYMEPYMASGYEEMARREYEESVRRAYYAEAVASSNKETNTFEGGAALASTGGGGGMTAFNPSHADPVYKTTNVGVEVGWGREAAMADQYGRLMAMREDEEML